MARHRRTPTPLPDTPLPTYGAYSFTVNEGERQVLVLALGELLQSIERSEHLLPTVQSLLDRLTQIDSPQVSS
ncbi:MAG TPA: hypothetical protein VKQ30_09730 [Ktedonobacterales bacterium]|nr:hypothetical protein [Ktedonobacterales bacterium]